MVVVAAPTPHSPYYSWEECKYTYTLQLINFLLLRYLDTYMDAAGLHGVIVHEGLS